METHISARTIIETHNPLRLVTIIRKVIIDNDTNRIVNKFGLSASGEWILVPDGARYPDGCVFRSGAGGNESFRGGGHNLARIKISDRLFLEALAFPPKTEIIECSFNEPVIDLIVWHPDLPEVSPEKAITEITPVITRVADDPPSRFYEFDWNLAKET